MKIINIKDGVVLTELSYQEVNLIRSALVEILYALDINDCETRTGFPISNFEGLLDQINNYIIDQI